MAESTRSLLGPSTTRGYTAEVVEDLLSRKEPRHVHSLRITFLPSFHSETCIEISTSADHGILLRLAYIDPCLWHTLSEREYEASPQGRLRPREDLSHLGPIQTHVHEIEVPVDAKGWDQDKLHGLIHQLHRESHSVREQLGIDGLQVLLDGSDDAATSRCSAWGLKRHDKLHEIASALFDLGRQHLPTGQAQSILDHLHGYLDLGLSGEAHADTGVIRLFGGIASTEESELMALLRQAEPGWTIDIRTLDLVAAILHAPIRNWVAQNRQVRWCHLAKHVPLLDALDVPEHLRS